MKYSLIILAIIASLMSSYVEANTHNRAHTSISKKIAQKHKKHKSDKKHSKINVKKSTVNHRTKNASNIGIASWYGYESVKKGSRVPLTASGAIFNPSKHTAAHRKLPFGTKVKVTNLANKQSVIVVINDRGPYAKHRLIDLSKSAAKSIGIKGIQKVSLNIIN